VISDTAFLGLVTAILTAMSGIGFVIAIWDPGALNMGIGCGLVAVVCWVALLWPIDNKEDKHER
jgi:hypothetical protein